MCIRRQVPCALVFGFVRCLVLNAPQHREENDPEMSRATVSAVSAACSFQLLPLPVKVSLAWLTGPSGFLVSRQSYPCPGPCSQCQPPPVQLHWLDAMSSGALIKCSVFCARFAHSGERTAVLIIPADNYIFAVCVTRMQREWLFWSHLQITWFSLLVWHFGAKRMALLITPADNFILTVCVTSWNEEHWWWVLRYVLLFTHDMITGDLYM